MVKRIIQFSFSIISFILFMHIFNSLSAFAAQTDFFVSTSGNDGNNGSLSSPFATIQKARDSIRLINTNMTGDIVVNILAGDYEITTPIVFDTRDSGTNGYNIIYKSYNQNGSARLLGGTKLTGWTLHSGNIYKKYVGTSYSFDTIYENGVRANSARTPNNSYLTVLSNDTTYPKQKFSYRDGELPQALTSVDNLKIGIFPNKYDWSIVRKKVSQIDTANRTITLLSGASDNLSTGSRYYAYGSYDFLDSPGEFYFDKANGWLYYWPMFGDINSQEIIMPTISSIIKFSGTLTTTPVKNVKLIGLTIGYSNYDLDIAADNANVYLAKAEYITIKDCKIVNAGVNGIAIRGYGKNNTIYGNLIDDVGYNGIEINSDKSPTLTMITGNNFVHNNLIRNINEFIGDYSGVRIAGSGYNDISNNKIYNSTRSGISLKGMAWSYMASAYDGKSVTYDNHWDFLQGKNNTIRYNDISNCNLDTQDAGVIEMWAPGKDNLVYNNKLYNSGRFGIQNGIYLDDDTSYTKVEKNIIYGITGDTVSGSYVKGVYNVLQNNIFDTTAGGVFMWNWAMPNDLSDYITLKNNIYYSGKGSDTIFKFTDWSSNRISYSDYNVFFNPIGKYEFEGIAEGKDYEIWRKIYGNKYDNNSSLFINPKFENPLAHNYSMQATSIARKKGIEEIDTQEIGIDNSFVYPQTQIAKPTVNGAIVKNQGFENGTANWNAKDSTLEISQSELFSGTNSCKVTNRLNSSSGIYQEMNFVNNSTYVISARVKFSNSSGNVKIYAQTVSNGQTNDRLLATEFADSYSFKEISCNYTFSESASLTSTKLFIVTENNTNDFFVDDVFAVLSPNIIQNSGFEQGTTNWSSSDCSMSADSAVKRSGNYSGKASNRTATYSSLRQNFAMTNGKRYYIADWVKFDNGTDNAVLWLELNIGGVTQYRVVDKKAVNSTEWTKLGGFYEVIENAPITSAKIYIATTTSKTAGTYQIVYTDDVFVGKVN